MIKTTYILSEAIKASVHLFNLAIGTLLWIWVFLPVIVTFVVPFTILRIVVNSLAKFIRPDLIPITNTVDHLACINPSSEFIAKNATQVWRLRGHLDASSFRRHFYETFLSTQELRVKYRNLYCHFVRWMAYGFKKPVDTIDLEDRIREHKLKDRESLEEFIGEWMSVNDYGDSPNWEILIIHMENNGNEFNEESCESVMLFKVDHGLCDGYTFVHLVDKLSGNKSPYIVKNETMSILTKMKHILTFPKIAVEYFCSFMMTSNPIKSQASSDKIHKWMISFTSLDLQAVKRVRQRTNTHFNTVLGILQFGAVRRHLLETGMVTSASKLPEANWIVSPTGRPGHPAMVPGGGGMTNHMTGNVWLNPLREEDPLNRLYGAEKEFLICEELAMKRTIRWILLPIGWVIPSPIAAWVVRNFLSSSSVSQVLSPLMCSATQYKLMGHHVNNLYLPVQLSGLVPFISIFVVPVSNSGRLDISINANTEMFKTQEELDIFTQVYMRDELNKLVRSSGIGYLDHEVFDEKTR